MIGLKKGELGWEIMTKFFELRLEIYSYLKDGDPGNKKTKGAKKCIIKRRLTFENYKYCLDNNKIRSLQRFRNEENYIFTKKVNKIALSANDDDNRLQTSDEVNPYTYHRH